MYDKKYFINKFFLVTGASSGIGKEVCIFLSRLGANLILCGRNEIRLNDVYDVLEKNNNKHQLFLGDLNNEINMDVLIELLPQLDGVVLSAGIIQTLPLKFLNADNLSEVMKTNFQTPIILIQKLIKKKLIKNKASIVFISSIAGNLIGSKGKCAYSASKSALNGISKVMALELASQKIRVNCINPGIVRTPMIDEDNGAITNEQFKEDEKAYPLGYGEPADVAGAVVFMLSDLSKWITGSSLIIDGGFTIV